MFIIISHCDIFMSENSLFRDPWLIIYYPPDNVNVSQRLIIFIVPNDNI
jgi:hypothetical protein